MPEFKVPQCNDRGLPPDILLIEDNAMDIKWTLRALGDNLQVCHAKSGHQALERLAEAKESPSARPRLVLLDITIAAPDGFALLSTIRNDPILSTLPVVILTQSNDPTDIRRAYEGLANCYVWKPRDREPFARAVQQIRDFWLSTATLPR
jgi:two-component system response regulator